MGWKVEYSTEDGRGWEVGRRRRGTIT